jgi:hypothetical protein
VSRNCDECGNSTVTCGYCGHSVSLHLDNKHDCTVRNCPCGAVTDPVDRGQAFQGERDKDTGAVDSGWLCRECGDDLARELARIHHGWRWEVA